MSDSGFQKVKEELEKRGKAIPLPIDPSRMKHAMDLAGFFDWPFWKENKKDLSRVVVVAGTNGKGTTCAVLDALLRDAGQTVGFYSSPHLTHYCERIRRGGEPISEDLFAQAYQEAVRKTKSIALTHFELLTVMALWVYCSGEGTPPIDRLILEVGLGGLWDATNSVPHGIAVITKLGLDHTQILGSTLNEVARNKLGIVPTEGSVIHHPFPVEAAGAISEIQKATHCRWIPTPPFKFDGKSGHPPEFQISTAWGRADLSLPGRRGAENTMLALQTFEALGFSPKNHLKVLQKVRWPGRMEKLSITAVGAHVYFSGDHNPQGVESLIELLEFYPREKLHIICGIGKDKDRDGILSLLFSIKNSDIYLTTMPSRGLREEDYGPWLKRAREFYPNPIEALKAAELEASERDMILVTGSFYLMEAFVSRIIDGSGDS